MAPTTKPDLQGFLAAVQQCVAHAANSCPPAGSTAAGQEAELGKRAGRSGFRGVTKHKRTQRFEAHYWADKQVYLGAYDSPHHAACAHDLAVLRFRGEQEEAAAGLNFPLSRYEDMLPSLRLMPQAEVVEGLRTFSKSLTAARLGRPARSCSRAASEDMGSSQSGRAGSVTSSRMSSEGAVSKRVGNKRKLSAPVASMPDLGALQQLIREQPQQGLPPRPPSSRLVQRRWQPERSQPAQQEACSGPAPPPAVGCSSAGSALTSSPRTQPSPSHQLPQLHVAATPLAASTQHRQPASPLKIAALQNVGFAPLQTTAAMRRSWSSPAIPGAGAVPPATWPPARTAPLCPPSFAPRALHPADPLLDWLLPLHSPPLLPQPDQGSEDWGGTTPLLSPVVASRAVRELASISTALAHPGSLHGG